MRKLKDNIAKAFHGITMTEALKKGICVDCRKSIAGTFMGDLSVKEYHISGLCQACQDSVFG